MTRINLSGSLEKEVNFLRTFFNITLGNITACVCVGGGGGTADVLVACILAIRNNMKSNMVKLVQFPRPIKSPGASGRGDGNSPIPICSIKYPMKKAPIGLRIIIHYTHKRSGPALCVPARPDSLSDRHPCSCPGPVR